MEEEKIILLEKSSKVRYAYLEENEKAKEEKVKQLECLLMQMVRVTVAETMKEIGYIVKEEVRESEKRIEDMLREERKEREKQWKSLEQHFCHVDKTIRKKQNQGKRKKHSIF